MSILAEQYDPFVRERGFITNKQVTFNSGVTFNGPVTGGFGLKLPTYTVGASNADFTSIQSALNAATSGGKIYLTDPLYTITSGLKIKGSNVYLIGNGPGGTVIQADGSIVSTLLSSNTTTYTGLNLIDVYLKQTNVSAQGVALDLSNMCLNVIRGLIIDSFGTALKLNDTANFTFYNRYADIRATNCVNGIDITSTNPVNDNTFEHWRIDLLAGGGGTGLKITKGNSNAFYNMDFEPGTGTGITGINLAPGTNGDVSDTSFYNLYCESNHTNVTINSKVQRTTFFGGQIIGGSTNLSDSGQDTQFFGTDIQFVIKNQQTAGTYVDSSNASKTFEFTNNVSFAHVSSALVDHQLQNSSDSSKLLRLRNAGTGTSLSVEDNSGNVQFAIDPAGKVFTNNAVSATTPGSVVKKLQIFDASGNSLGFIPIYSAIT